MCAKDVLAPSVIIADASEEFRDEVIIDEPLVMCCGCSDGSLRACASTVG